MIRSADGNRHSALLAAICVAALVSGLSTAPPALAATRTCGEVIATAGEDPASDLKAKQKAMAGWLAAAAKLGPAYSVWRNAIDRSLSCLKLADGTRRCQAYARPCGITQIPGALPPGTLPQVPAPPKREQRI